MKNLFIGFLGYTNEEIKELWENATFVVDTNILINFYKYSSKESTKSLLDILKNLKQANRLWIPHQVALEYFFNYEDNMHRQHEGYTQLGKELKKLKESASKVLSSVKSKHPYIMTEKFKFFIDNIEKSNQQLQEKLDKEIESLPDANTIQDDLLNLLDGIIGEPYSQKKIDEIEKAGKDRYEHKVPPGFEDMGKDEKEGFRTYGDIRYQQLYGDLIVWNQILDRARNTENPTSIIFITEDRKEDWWEKDSQNRIKRPHPLLLQEFLNETQNNFYMYRTDKFVELSQQYLEADVTDEQVENVTKDIVQIRKSEENEEIEKVVHNQRVLHNQSLWLRNPKIASKALAYANYLCEFDNAHELFISKFNKRNYVEAHHLIPLEYQDDFTYSLDTPANIVSLCLVCHKKIHSGVFEEKKEILEKLYNSRIERLKTSGIYIDITQLYSYYQD